MLRIAIDIMPLKWICTVYMLLHMKKIGLPAAFVPTRLSLVDFFVVTCGSGLDTNGQNSETWIKQEVENLNTICTFGLFWRWSQLGNCITEDGRTGRHYFSCLRSILEWNNNNCNRLHGTMPGVKESRDVVSCICIQHWLFCYWRLERVAFSLIGDDQT